MMPKAEINPSSLLTFPGIGTSFSMTVGGRSVSATWTIKSDGGGIGTIDSDTGWFTPHDELRYPKGTVTATTVVDGKPYKKQAQIRIMLGSGLMNSAGQPFLAEYFGPLPCATWNDDAGYRAAKLIWDAVQQLPKKFLDLVGEVAIVRVKGIAGFSGGMHLPLPGRVILLPDEIVSRLKNSPQITNEDRAFVETIVHEMAHCAVCNRCIGDFNRWLGIVLLAANLAGQAVAVPALPIAAALLKWVTQWDVFAIPSLATLLLQYYNPLLRQEDDITAFSKATGWVIRDPNPFSLIWGGPGVPPNVITGFRFVGGIVGLRNERVSLDSDLKTNGVYRSYSLTDVHEDFADSIASLAMGEDYTGRPGFKSRWALLVKLGYWPKDNPDPLKRKHKVSPGANSFQWARSNGEKDPPFNLWGIFMGYYAGPSSSNTKVVSKSTSRPRISAMQYESQDDEDPGSTDDEMSLAPMGDGYTSELDSEGLQDALNFAQSSKSIEEYHQVYLERAEPVVRQVSDAVSRLEMPLLEGTLIEFLRAAECHGQGLRMIEQIDSDQQRGLRYPGGTNVGDILVANDNSIWIVIRVREDGCIAEITGAPTINEGKPAFQVKELTLLYVWRPVEILRQWCENLSPAEQIAYAKITRLWGVETTPSGRDLDRPVSFLKEIADLLGAKPWKTADVEDDTLLRFAKQHGLQGVDEWASELQVGDVIRMKNGIWGIVLGSSPWRILVQGGKKLGEFNEECMAAKLTLRLEIPDVDYVWCHESFRNLS